MRLILLLIMILPIISACKRTKIDPLPDEMIHLPGLEESYGLRPIKINNNNYIIGYAGGGPDDILPLDNKAIGFITDHQAGFFISLKEALSATAWPLDINDSDIIVGQYSHSGHDRTAFRYDIHSHTVKDLIPENADWSSAKKISNDGKIVGQYGMNEQSKIFAVLHDSEFSLFNDQAFEYETPLALNDDFLVFQAYDGSQSLIYTYEWANGQIELLNFGSHDIGFAWVEGINDNNEVVGFLLPNGFVYDLNNRQLKLFHKEIDNGSFIYDQFDFKAINNHGNIVGISHRHNRNQLGQGRAMRISNRFNQFADLTPAGYRAYSELISVNDAGLALGSMGIHEGHGSYRAVIVVVNSNP